MEYSDYSSPSALDSLGLVRDQQSKMFAFVKAQRVAPYLKAMLQENIGLATAYSTEKMRSELLIAPILVEARRVLDRKVSLFSGAPLNVEPERGLMGTCDFLLTRSPQYSLEHPILAVVEAKNENISAGIGQCAAEMLAAQILNEREGTPQPVIFGCVTSGTAWRFLDLRSNKLTVDLDEYAIQQVSKVLGIFVWMLKQTEPPLQTR